MFRSVNTSVRAGINGFPDPSKAHLKETHNLDKIFVTQPSATRIIKSPNAIHRRGIALGDWLIVNSSLVPCKSDIVLACIDGDMVACELNSLKDNVARHDVGSVLVVQLCVHFYSTAPLIPSHTSMSEISLHKLLIPKKEYATVLARLSGDSMRPYAETNDLILIERHLAHQHGSVCVFSFNGELVLKRLNTERQMLESDNSTFQGVAIRQTDKVTVEGVVQKVLRPLRSASSSL